MRDLYSRVFGAQSHIEWNDVKRYLADVSHTTEEWLALVNLLDFAEEDALRMRPEVLQRALVNPWVGYS